MVVLEVGALLSRNQGLTSPHFLSWRFSPGSRAREPSNYVCGGIRVPVRPLRSLV
jgi:hypothetical protein